MEKPRVIGLYVMIMILVSLICVSSANAAAVPPSLDPTSASHKLQYVSAQGSTSLTITTSAPQEIIYATFYSVNTEYGLSISSNPALSWHYRGGRNSTQNDRGEIAAWWALSTSPQTVQITFTSSQTASNKDYIVDAFCVLNANTASPFDPNVNSVVFSEGNSVSASATLTTTDTNDLVVGVLGIINNKAITEGAGYTLIDKVSTSASGANEYKLAATAGTVTPTFTLASGAWVEIADAFVGTSMSVLPEYGFGAIGSFGVCFAAMLLFFYKKNRLLS